MWFEKEKNIYCEDCRFFEKDSTVAFDRCLHPKAQWVKKASPIRREAEELHNYSCEYMREWECKKRAKYFEPREVK